MVSTYGEGARMVERLRDRLGDDLADALDDGMDTAADETRRQLRLNDSVARRVLVNAIRVARSGLRSPDTITSRGVYAPPFWQYLEYGTGVRGEGEFPSPIVPPYEAIFTWIVAKGIQPRAESIDTQAELATVIQDTIADVGTYSHPFARPAWYGPQGFEQVRRRLVMAINTAQRRVF